MRDVWNWVRTCLGTTTEPNRSELINELDQRLWSVVQHRINELSPSQLSGYVWAYARATGILATADARLTSPIVDEVAERFSQRHAAQQTGRIRRAA